MKRSVLPALILVLVFCSENVLARFELIREWVIPEPIEEGYFLAPIPGWPLRDGSKFLVDRYGYFGHLLWRLQGTTLTPVTGFNPSADSIEQIKLFDVGDMVVLSVILDGEQQHWKIDGTDAFSLEPLFGPVPFHSEWLWTPLESEVVLSARTEEHGRELWRIDQNGYHLISDLNPGPGDSHPSEAGWNAFPIYDWFDTAIAQTGTETRLMFTLDDGSTGPEPWVYNADDGSLTLVGDLAEGADGSFPWWLGTLGGNQYFGTLDRNIYKSDEVSAVSIGQGAELFSYASRYSQDAFEFEGDLYVWWGPHGFDPYGYITRISNDDTIRLFTARRFPAAPEQEIASVFPFDGAVQIVTADSNAVLRIENDEVGPSDLFTGEAVKPRVISWTDSEVLFQENGSGLFRHDVYCLVDGEAVAVWRKPTDIPFAAADVIRLGDWIYLRVSDFPSIIGDVGGTGQLWGMHFPSGCQQPWIENFLITAKLNDAWFNPQTPGQGFSITVFEESEKMFLAWFTFDTEPPDGDAQANLGAPGHRWMTAYGSFQGDRAELAIEKTVGGVFNAATPETDQFWGGSMDIQFIDCNSAVVTYSISNHPVSIEGTIPIERVATSNVAACEEGLE